jgi:hypothetical protein
MFQVLQVFQRYVAKADRDITKVDWKVTHVTMSTQEYFMCMFQNVLSVSHECCKYFMWIDVAKVDLDITYTCMLQVYVSSASSVC